MSLGPTSLNRPHLSLPTIGVLIVQGRSITLLLMKIKLRTKMKITIKSAIISMSK